MKLFGFSLVIIYQITSVFISRFITVGMYDGLISKFSLLLEPTQILSIKGNPGLSTLRNSTTPTPGSSEFQSSTGVSLGAPQMSAVLGQGVSLIKI